MLITHNTVGCPDRQDKGTSASQVRELVYRSRVVENVSCYNHGLLFFMVLRGSKAFVPHLVGMGKCGGCETETIRAPYHACAQKQWIFARKDPLEQHVLQLYYVRFVRKVSFKCFVCGFVAGKKK